jgi:NAD(P)-dependent dehydrogenase (short-subunit alcohol dehydrogenase family)
LVTGASRGIGKAIALALARAGYDVAVSARTVAPGEVRDNTSTIHGSDRRALPGSLQETAEAVEAEGRRALTIPADLTDRASVGACAQALLDKWGGADLLVHNGRYVGPGMMDLFLDTPVEAYEKLLEAHCIAPVILTRALLPGMLERGFGQVVNITSSAAYRPAKAPAGKGDFGIGYAVGKAAGHPLIGVLHAEFHDRGVQAFNVQPGLVATERNEIAMGDRLRGLTDAAPPAAIGAVVAWLATSDEAGRYSGTNVIADELGRERKLHASWR